MATPYHQDYYAELDQCTRDLITAQYTADPAVVRSFIQQYGITHWLLDPLTFNPDALAANRWVQQH